MRLLFLLVQPRNYFYSGIINKAIIAAPTHDAIDTAPLIISGSFSFVESDANVFAVGIFDSAPMTKLLIIRAITKPILI